MTNITKIRVVSRFFITDIIAGIKNSLGMRITQYEKMIQEAQEDIWKELDNESISLEWYRYEITELTNGAIVIMLYGNQNVL